MVTKYKIAHNLYLETFHTISFGKIIKIAA